MSKKNLYRIKIYIFDIRIELACNHAKLYSILKNFIFLSHASHRENHKINIKISLVKDIDFSSRPLNNNWLPVLNFSLIKCFFDKIYNYYYYTDSKTYIITLKSKSEMEVKICKKLLKYPAFIKYYAILPGLIEILRRNNIFPLHAAALEKEKTGYLFPGHSRSGKTTLSLALIKKGYRFLSDDTVFIKYAGNPIEVGIITNRDLNIKKNTGFISQIINEVKGNSQVKIVSDKKSIMFNPAIIWPNQMVNKIQLDKIIFPRITNQRKTSIAVISQRQAFHLLIKSKILFAYTHGTLIGKNINCLKKISSLKERYILFLGRDALTNPETIPRILDCLKKE